jgi:AraC-like DNA-binding protein
MDLVANGRREVAMIELVDPIAEGLELIQRLHIEHPWLPILAYVRLQRQLGPILAAALAAGAASVAIEGFDDFAALIVPLAMNGIVAQAAAQIWVELKRHVPVELTMPIRYWLNGLSLGRNVDDATREMRITRRALCNRFARCGWPPPVTTLSWLRLMAAVQLLTRPEMSIGRTARAVGYSSPGRLQLLPRRLLGVDLKTSSQRELIGLTSFFIASLPSRTVGPTDPVLA